MTGYPGGFFRPRQEVSRVEAIVALNRGTNLPADRPTATTEKTTPEATATATPTPATQAPRRAARKPLFIPLAMTSMMQPLLVAAANARNTPPAAPTQPAPDGQAAPSDDTPSPEATPLQAKEPEESASRPASVVLSEYYTDAQSIPQYAVNSVAEATKANVVVNYPNPRVLNPAQPASRGDIAAFVHQALVAQGRIEPLPGEVKASNYIVGRDRTQGNQTAR
jgi:S-layer homology domain